MFGNRKRKLKDDDDSLVPHGLIWHATQPALTENEKSVQNSNQRAEVIEITRTPATQAVEQKTQVREADTSLPSPSKADYHTVASPGSPSEVSASQPPPPITPLAPNGNLQGLRVAEIIEIAPAASEEPSRMELAYRAITRLVSITFRIGNAVLRASNKAQDDLVRMARSLEFMQQTFHGAQLTAGLRKSIHGTNGHAQKLKARTVQLGKITQQETRRVFESLRIVYSEVRNRVSNQSNFWRTARVRIVLTGLPLRVKILFARRLSEWKITQAVGTDDERLRSSMTFAAIAATIVLIIISVVPRYAAKSLPSRLLDRNAAITEKTIKSSMAAPVVGNLIVKPAEVIEKTSATTKPRESGHTQKPSIATARTPRHKIYRTAEDDYIAPDTYIYYGNKSPAVR